ncbi:MAG: hypothetical protein ACJAUW_000152, partial [Yoonia sp.]
GRRWIFESESSWLGRLFTLTSKFKLTTPKAEHKTSLCGKIS